MSKINGFLLACLLINATIAGVVLRYADSMQSWARSVPQQTPAVDPRIVAASLAREINTAESNLQRDVVRFRDLVLPPQTVSVEAIEESDDSPAIVKSKVQLDADDRRVRQILSAQIGFHEIDELLEKLDPDRVGLPTQVSMYNDAMLGWMTVRKRWPQPIGKRELDSLLARTGLHPQALAAMDQRIPDHVDRVVRGIRSFEVDIVDAVRWLEQDERAELYPHEYRNRRQSDVQHHWKLWCRVSSLVDNETPSQAMLDGWVRMLPFSKVLSEEESLSGASRLDIPEAWKPLNVMASSHRTSTEQLLTLQDHSLWHLAKCNDHSLAVLEALWANPSFPTEKRVLNFATAPDEEFDQAALDQMSLTDALKIWIVRLQSGAPEDQANVYREMLMIGPRDDQRRQVQAIAAGYRPTSDLGRSLSAALWCRWATPDDAAMLAIYATSEERTRSSPDDPDATAEAIQTLCGIDNAQTRLAAAHWGDQVRWPRSVSEAWINGGSAGETALCGVLLSSLLGQDESSRPRVPGGFQRILDVLAKSGGTRSLATLNTFESLLQPSDRTPATQRFLRSCRSRIERRIEVKRAADTENGTPREPEGNLDGGAR